MKPDDDSLDLLLQKLRWLRLPRMTRLVPSLLEQAGKDNLTDLEVVLRRLLTLDLATIDEYRAYRARWARERQAERDAAEPQNWGEKQHEIAMRTQGLPFVRLVLDAMHRDEVTAADVSDFLDMKLDYLNDLELAVVAAGSSG